MMANTGGEVRKLPERKQVGGNSLLDLDVPFVKKITPSAGGNNRMNRGDFEDEIVADGDGEKKGMMFTLLTKKGNKQQVSLNSFPLVNYLTLFANSQFSSCIIRHLIWKFH